MAGTTASPANAACGDIRRRAAHRLTSGQALSCGPMTTARSHAGGAQAARFGHAALNEAALARRGADVLHVACLRGRNVRRYHPGAMEARHATARVDPPDVRTA